MLIWRVSTFHVWPPCQQGGNSDNNAVIGVITHKFMDDDAALRTVAKKNRERHFSSVRYPEMAVVTVQI